MGVQEDRQNRRSTCWDEKIHEAWRACRVLSLVSFGVQGAFNGVHPSVLAERLRERRKPAELVAWVESFCSGRKASVVVGDYELPISEIEHTRIPQGSPLSPILYVFCNANLAQSRINKSEGPIGFIEDNNAWVTGPSMVENARKLQTQLLPRAGKWARESGAVFEADKTAFIHFVRPLQPDQRRPNHLVFGSNREYTDSANVHYVHYVLSYALMRHDMNIERLHMNMFLCAVMVGTMLVPEGLDFKGLHMRQPR